MFARKSQYFDRCASGFSLTTLKHKALTWLHTQYNTLVYLDSNQDTQNAYRTYECLIAATNIPPITHSTRPNEVFICTNTQQQNSFEQLQKFYQQHPDWLFGCLSYDLKNEVETLKSNNNDVLEMPQLLFFRPSVLLLIKVANNNIVELQSTVEPTGIWQSICAQTLGQSNISTTIAPFKARMSQVQYLQKVAKLREHIRLGDVYEINLCQEFFAQPTTVCPISTFWKLNEQAQAPFTAYVQYQQQYLLCYSPERFLKKVGPKLISQPIKGTIKRSYEAAQDEALKQQLYEDPKERAENVMIVDLVRNDLTRNAKFGTIKVEELFGVYSFKTVHHLISTISAVLREGADFIEALKAAFPMGSMTGAPKIMAMELIEQYEMSKRGWYSGSVGYINPAGDFDFNVVIRSLLYHACKQYLSLQVGGAITYQSEAVREYEECLLKAKGIFEGLRAMAATPTLV